MKKYLITDPLFYSSKPKIVLKKLLTVMKTTTPDFVCIRDKTVKNYRDIAREVQKIVSYSKILLHTDYVSAHELGFYGVHLPFSRVKDILKAKKLGLHVVVSTHTLKEALHAKKLGADFITFSPIFYTPNKGVPKGLEKLKEINDKINIDCFALGGIVSENQIQACKNTGVYGFASIRYFIQQGN
ncbi:MAG: thiamine phosphate synthase [Sulfurospirillum sp.]|nr:thiamine phosphate synthase [Sulfurospirillum sp.]